uniref:Uncharacterized protein n=1 Tax=Fagus sylvatica TaxID=28930 RepID=A0A2N9F3B8_FAGSY
MNCPSCLPQLPLPPPSNVPPLLYPPPPPLSSTPPPPLSSTPPTPRRRTPRSSKGRWYKSNVATGSAISLSSVSFVGVFVVIYRQFFKPEKDEDLTVSGTIKVSGKVSITISPPTPPPSPPTPIPCCDSCASDCTPSRRTCHDSYVQGSCTQAYPVEWNAHQAAMGVTEHVNEEYYIEPAEYMWSKLCD